jgi:hypothetical protein
MKNKIILFFALVLIGAGIFLGYGIRAEQKIVEKPVELTMIEKTS